MDPSKLLLDLRAPEPTRLEPPPHWPREDRPSLASDCRPFSFHHGSISWHCDMKM